MFLMKITLFFANNFINMSKFLHQKRKLLEEVLEKASSETTETSSSGILKSLERTLLDDFRISLSYKTLETYYKTILENDSDYNIKPAILDDLSVYLGYDSFRDFCFDWKTIEYTITQTLSKIVINITNKPIFTMPNFVKNGFGIVEFSVLLLFLIGSIGFSKKKDEKNNLINNPIGFLLNESLDIDKDYMYWNGQRFIATDSSSLGPQFNVRPMNKEQFKYLKKITRPDTIKSVKGIWYSKYQNEVEFFTADGVNPDNGKELKPLTDGMLDKYGN